MIVLGIESTAHTLGVGILDTRNRSKYPTIIVNERSLFTTKKGGMIPSKVADFHVENCEIVLQKAIEKAANKYNTTKKEFLKKIKLISFSQSPGIGHSLRIGATVARTIATKLNIPIIGVNHCIAHLEIGRGMTNAKDPILLYLSGANTQVIAYEAGRYRIFGEALDGGIGNFLDSFARHIDLGFPGGPKVYEKAQKIHEKALNQKATKTKSVEEKKQEYYSKRFVELPYTVKGMDVSFGGILTNLKQKVKSGKYNNEQLCFSAQETVFTMMLEVAERAMAHCDKKELLLGGGVACNKRLQEMAQKMCKERKAKCYILPNELNVDNGSMIAWLGYIMHKAKKKKDTIPNIKKTIIDPYVRTDEVEVYWR